MLPLVGFVARLYKIVYIVYKSAYRGYYVGEVQSRFLVDVSHELQTPVAVLAGNLEILEGKRRGNRKVALRVMAATLTRMSRMVEHLLASARLDFSNDELCCKGFTVAELLEEAYDDCLVLAKNKRVALSHESDKACISGDKDKLKEVILNLISNALKHTARGGTITLVGTAKGAHVEIVVQDTGSGIAPEDLPHIFERFYRIGGDSSPGTGLGLDICRKIVEAHGGTITAVSEFGRGSRFIVLLPCHKEGAKGKN